MDMIAYAGVIVGISLTVIVVLLGVVINRDRLTSVNAADMNEEHTRRVHERNQMIAERSGATCRHFVFGHLDDLVAERELAELIHDDEWEYGYLGYITDRENLRTLWNHSLGVCRNCRYIIENYGYELTRGEDGVPDVLASWYEGELFFSELCAAVCPRIENQGTANAPENDPDTIGISWEAAAIIDDPEDNEERIGRLNQEIAAENDSIRELNLRAQYLNGERFPLDTENYDVNQQGNGYPPQGITLFGECQVNCALLVRAISYSS
ncbi:MAG: hypothetical protein LUD72_14585, partial [Bacteroidales bacterium]|nr:hypothetical protein [Bacteroidales bacterium]